MAGFSSFENHLCQVDFCAQVLKVEFPIRMHTQPISAPYFVVMLGAKAPRKKSGNALNPVTTEGVLRREDGSGSQYAATISQGELR